MHITFLINRQRDISVTKKDVMRVFCILLGVGHTNYNVSRLKSIYAKTKINLGAAYLK